jgi:hypothetical protein
MSLPGTVPGLDVPGSLNLTLGDACLGLPRLPEVPAQPGHDEAKVNALSLFPSSTPSTLSDTHDPPRHSRCSIRASRVYCVSICIQDIPPRSELHPRNRLGVVC